MGYTKKKTAFKIQTTLAILISGLWSIKSFQNVKNPLNLLKLNELMTIQWNMHWFYPYRPSKIVIVKNKKSIEKDLKLL